MNPRTDSATGLGGDGATAAPVTQDNAILARLPRLERAEVLEHTEKVTCSIREIVFEPNEPMTRVLFPLTGMISILTVLRDGTSIEAMTVGREGVVGLPVFHGVGTAGSRGICQIAGDFYELTADAFRSLVSDGSNLASLLHRYAQFSNEVMAQTAACNSIHLIEQRCARWLLTTADAVDRERFDLTQEFLAQMLAVRRSGVTMAIGGLERQGLISHRYGSVTIVDAAGLRKVACECYATIADRARELLVA